MEKGLSIKKNIIYNTVGSVFYLACQWLTTILVVHLGNYEMAGDLSLAISLSNIYTAIANYGMRNYQVSDVSNKYSASNYVTLRYLTSLFALLLCVVVTVFNGHYSIEQKLVIVIYMVFKLSEAVSDVYQGIQQKAYRMDYIGISFILRGAISVLLFSLGLVVTKSLVFATTFMAAGTFAVIIFYDYRICNRMEKLKLSINSTIKKGLFECTPLMVTLVLATVSVAIPRYALEKMYGSEMLGYYASVATPAVIVQSICLMVYMPLTTMMAESYEQKNSKAYRSVVIKSIAAMAAVSIASIGGAYLLGEWGLKLLFGEDILLYAYLFVPAIITTVMVAFVYYLNMVLTIARRQNGIMIINALSVICILIVMPGFLTKYNMNGVNFTIIAGFAVDILLLSVLWVYDCIKHFKEERNA